jgi:hypothetical protein
MSLSAFVWQKVRKAVEFASEAASPVVGVGSSLGLAAAAVGTAPNSEPASHTSWAYDTASPEARADVFSSS